VIAGIIHEKPTFTGGLFCVYSILCSIALEALRYNQSESLADRERID